MLFFGDTIFRWLGMEPPQAWTQIKSNPALLIGAYFMLNMVYSQIISTGAFEITYNGGLVFSKLEAGRMPSLQELFKVLEETHHLAPVNQEFVGAH
mmetsp:Transcript_865/g.2465  ORF Transcript_865/g.2465 Transcript_865/m.2465 type:complete len:96 (-) Transcript_865:132-419(-)